MWRRLAVLILSISMIVPNIIQAQADIPPQIAVVDAYVLIEDMIDIGWLGWITLINQSDQAVSLIAVNEIDTPPTALPAGEPTPVFMSLQIPDEIASGDALPVILTFSDAEERHFDVPIAMPILDGAPSEARIAVADVWARPMDEGGVSGVYMQMFNLTDADVTIVEITSPLSPLAEIHETSVNGGIMRMIPLSELVIPANGTAILETGGHHLMLNDLSAELIDGAALSITLHFDDGGEQTIGVPIYDRLLSELTEGTAHHH